MDENEEDIEKNLVGLQERRNFMRKKKNNQGGEVENNRGR